MILTGLKAPAQQGQQQDPPHQLSTTSSRDQQWPRRTTKHTQQHHRPGLASGQIHPKAIHLDKQAGKKNVN